MSTENPVKFTVELELPEGTTAADVQQSLQDVIDSLNHYDDQKNLEQWHGLSGGVFLPSGRAGAWRIAPVMSE